MTKPTPEKKLDRGFTECFVCGTNIEGGSATKLRKRERIENVRTNFVHMQQELDMSNRIIRSLLIRAGGQAVLSNELMEFAGDEENYPLENKMVEDGYSLEIPAYIERLKRKIITPGESIVNPTAAETDRFIKTIQEKVK